MKSTKDGNCNPDKQLAAVCGLFCPSCTLFIGTTEDPERLKLIALRVHRSIDELRCKGCHSEKRSYYCESCRMKKCAAQKGVAFCGECGEYPCRDLSVFQAEMPHRIELWKSQERIREAGYETWYAEMVEHYSCPSCRTLNSAYDLKCRKCGATPGSAYVKLHKEAILEHLDRRK